MLKQNEWSWFKNFSIVTDNPLFTETDCRNFFDFFASFASTNLFFKFYPDEALTALRQSKYDFSKNFIKGGLLEAMKDRFPTGAFFNDMLAFTTVYLIGADFANEEKQLLLKRLVSRGGSVVTAEHIDAFCKEFEGEQIRQMLMRLLEEGKDQLGQ